MKKAERLYELDVIDVKTINSYLHINLKNKMDGTGHENPQLILLYISPKWYLKRNKYRSTNFLFVCLGTRIREKLVR